MEITFFKGVSDLKRNYVGEIIKIQPVTLIGELKEEQDISNPTIIVDISSSSNFSESTLSTDITDFKENFYNFNRAYIPKFSRIYDVTKVTVIRKNIISFSLHVNVLTSFKDFIRNQTAFVTRNQYQFDRWFADERRIVMNEKIVEYFNSDVSSDINTVFNPNMYNKKHISISVIADGIPKSTFELNANNIIRQSTLSGLPDANMGYFMTSTQNPKLIDDEGMGDVLYELLHDNNLESYVGGIYAFPFEITDTTSDTELDLLIHNKYIMNDANQNVKYKGLKTLSTELIIASFYLLSSTYISDFNDLEPYSMYELYIPYYGFKQIPFNQLLGRKLKLYYIVNYKDGSATAYLYNDTDHKLVFSTPVQLGIEIPKSTTNEREVKDRADANRMNLTLSLIGSMLSIGVGVATGGIGALGVVGGIMGTTKAIGSAVQNEKTNYERAQLQFASGGNAMISPQTAFIRKTKSRVHYPLNNDFLSYNGGVCNELMSLSYIRGYTEIGEIEYVYFNGNNITQPTETELNEITNLLKSGVYFSDTI